MIARGVFFGVVSAILGATPSGDGSIYRPKTLTRAQVTQYAPELTATYGAQYVAMLRATAKR